MKLKRWTYYKTTDLRYGQFKAHKLNSSVSINNNSYFSDCYTFSGNEGKDVIADDKNTNTSNIDKNNIQYFYLYE